MYICKYCNSIMHGETETLSKDTYSFFYVCPNCSSVYEGKMKESKKEKRVINARWFNPVTKEFEYEK